MTNNEKYRKILCRLLKAKEVKDTYEIINFHTVFDAEQKIDHNYVYGKQELIWYLSQDLCINGYSGIDSNPIWKSIATEDGHVNSNYGWCIFDEDNCNQYISALNALINDRETRQSICIYTRPNIQQQWNDNIHAHHDMICTFATQHFIRNNKLEYIVNMRSNDAYRGFRNDFAWHQYVYNLMLTRLVNTYPRLKYGNIYWNAGSFHLYKRDVDKVIKEYNIIDCG